MAPKLFLLGLPGSGKSTIARYITEYVRDWNWPTVHYSDYPVLNEMFRNDIEGKLFKPAKNGGFDVWDLTVLDTALQQLEQQIRQDMPTKGSTEIALIEFSRNDYQHAFGQFSTEFLQDQHTYFLYLDAKQDICQQRISQRTTDPKTNDDYSVSQYIFEHYYDHDDGKRIPNILKKEYQIDSQRAKIIPNNGPLEAAAIEIQAFLNSILAQVS